MGLVVCFGCGFLVLLGLDGLLGLLRVVCGCRDVVGFCRVCLLVLFLLVG